MDAKEAIKACFRFSDMVASSYLGDLTDADLLVRPVPGANHIAWQLGHLIAAEHQLMEMVAPGKMPKLPAGFVEKYSKETAASDDAASFHKKDEYRKLAKEQREGTIKILDSLSDDDLSKPGPERMRQHVPTVGDLIEMQGSHVLMHSGQWALVRRKLGRPPLF